MQKPRRLHAGARVAIVSPSNGLPYRFPGIYALGLNNLREVFGLEVVEFPTARQSPQELYRHPERRAQDLNAAFADRSIDGIITSIGGYESVRILKYLDVETILSHPKLLMGFSDATTFLAYLSALGMVTFYGPSVMAGFAQTQSLPPEWIAHVKAMLFAGTVPYTYSPYGTWADGYPDWSNPATHGQCNEFLPNAGWRFIQGRELARGRLWGGCIEVLEFLKSTDYWPERSFWQDKILCLEASEEAPPPRNVGYMLRNYGIQGVFGQIRGLLIGRPQNYTAAQKQEMEQLVGEIVGDEFHAGDLPVAVNVDFGHTDPKLILPLGCEAVLDPATNGFQLTESPFAE